MPFPKSQPSAAHSSTLIRVPPRRSSSAAPNPATSSVHNGYHSRKIISAYSFAAVGTTTRSVPRRKPGCFDAGGVDSTKEDRGQR